MSFKLTCPQCQTALKLVNAPMPGVGVTCPNCRLKFVPTAAPLPQAASAAAGSPVAVVLIAIVLGLSVAGVVMYYQMNRDGPPAATVENKQAPSATANTNASETPPTKSKADLPDSVPTPKPPSGIAPAPSTKQYPQDELPDQPGVTSKKPAQKKTYAEIKRPLLDEPPPVAPIVTVRPQPAAAEHPKQKLINEAIDKGVAFLKRGQLLSGTWSQTGSMFEYDVGYAALAGLTLLECQVPPDDPVIQKAVALIRRTPIANSMRTYQLGLAILFLDRLGDPKDRRLIQAYALQLVAGQNRFGLWTYTCPDLTPQEHKQLWTFLEATRLPTALAETEVMPKPGPQDENAPKLAPPKNGDDARDNPPDKKPPARPKPPVPLAKELLRAVADTTVVLHWYVPKAQQAALANPMMAAMDNSNSQFALLGLWAARRHGVCTERSLLLAAQRHAETQNADGGWTYNIRVNNVPDSVGESAPAMTCVGLLGLAMGHGVSPPKKPAEDEVAPLFSPIDRGLDRLSRSIDATSLNNFYFLWSMERVAVLYDLKMIGGKDWYSIGVDMLLPLQQAEGAWSTSGYSGSSPVLDSCFALLFLKRSNLVQDLTERLPFLMGISDPSSRSKR